MSIIRKQISLVFVKTNQTTVSNLNILFSFNLLFRTEVQFILTFVQQCFSITWIKAKTYSYLFLQNKLYIFYICSIFMSTCFDSFFCCNVLRVHFRFINPYFINIIHMENRTQKVQIWISFCSSYLYKNYLFKKTGQQKQKI